MRLLSSAQAFIALTAPRRWMGAEVRKSPVAENMGVFRGALLGSRLRGATLTADACSCI